MSRSRIKVKTMKVAPNKWHVALVEPEPEHIGWIRREGRDWYWCEPGTVEWAGPCWTKDEAIGEMLAVGGAAFRPRNLGAWV